MDTVINFESFCSNFDTPELRQEVFETFKTVVPSYLQSFEEAIITKNFLQFEQTAHRYKSGAFSMGALSIYETLNMAEQIAKGKNNIEELKSILQKVNILSAKASAELSEFMKNDK
ncbi:MAG: hypothetical protein V2A54_03025 [Bacteroidota bacterium]